MDTSFARLRDQLDGFLSEHLAGLENEERVEALAWYCQGLGLEVPDKSVFGIASRLAPNAVQAVRQRMQRALQRSRFSHEAVFERIQRTVFGRAADRIEAYCVDDTGFEKKGEHSVGVQRQYSGTLGKVGNCQIAVSLHGVSDDFSACLSARLYLPESWAQDAERMQRADVPTGTAFQTKAQIALDLLRAAKTIGAPKRPVVADAGFGDSSDFRDAIVALGFHYVVAVSSQMTVWPPDASPAMPAPNGKRGRPRTRVFDDAGASPIRINKLAAQLWEQGQFRQHTWRQSTRGPLHSDFCAVRVQSAELRAKRKALGPSVWLLIERDATQKTGFRYYLSSLPSTTSVKTLARLGKMRWRIERDYQDMKQKLGLDKYEGRTWGGFHRHFAMVALVHAFLSLHRESFSLSEPLEPVELARLSSRSA